MSSHAHAAAALDLPSTHHRSITLDNIRLFYREAGDPDAPILLLPHGYPSSSFQYRTLIPALADRYRLIAPDLPAFGHSDTPDPSRFDYSFSGYAAILLQLAQALNLPRYTLYLHDYGSQIGFRLAILAPERVSALIIQNGDIYEDQLGPQYADLQAYWSAPTPAGRQKLADTVTPDGFRREFLNGVLPEHADRLSPDLWQLAWAQLNTPARREIMIRLMEGLKENLRWFPRYQQYLRRHRPPALILWGPRDGFMPHGAARAYLRDLPSADLHIFDDAGHWLLESHFDLALPLIRDFLARVHASSHA